MKFLIAITTLVAAALASPMPQPDVAVLEKRQSSRWNGQCVKVVMVYARGSTELGNVGTLGPGLESGLKRKFPGQFQLQGVEYPADLFSNFLPEGSNNPAIRQMREDITKIHTKCPETRIAAGGYSQGSALAASAIEGLSDEIKDKIDAVVFFGYTKNLQNRGVIPKFPKEKLLVICNVGDMVCTGTLVITIAHLTYAADVNKAVNFIAKNIKA